MVDTTGTTEEFEPVIYEEPPVVDHTPIPVWVNGTTGKSVRVVSHVESFIFSASSTVHQLLGVNRNRKSAIITTTAALTVRPDKSVGANDFPVAGGTALSVTTTEPLYGFINGAGVVSVYTENQEDL